MACVIQVQFMVRWPLMEIIEFLVQLGSWALNENQLRVYWLELDLSGAGLSVT